MKYKIYELKELVKICYGKNQKKVHDDNGDFPIYGTGGLMGFTNKCLYDKPSVLIGRKGTIGRVKYVDYPFWTVDTLFYTQVNENLVYPKYLYYLMSLIDLNIYNEGTTIPSLRTETLYRMELKIASLEYQKRVLSIIEPIDSKIMLNGQININKVHPHKFRRTLATMAIDKGMPIQQLQHLLGHQKIDTTLQYAIG